MIHVHSPQWVSMYSRNFGYDIIARPSVCPHLGVSRLKMSHVVTTIMDKSLGSHLHLWGFLHNHTCPTPPPTHRQGWTRVSRIFLEFQLCIGMSLNNLAAITSRTSLLASSTFMPSFYLDSCQTPIICGKRELQVIFKRLHCFMRTFRNEKKLRKLLHCPKDFCPGL